MHSGLASCLPKFPSHSLFSEPFTLWLEIQNWQKMIELHFLGVTRCRYWRRNSWSGTGGLQLYLAKDGSVRFDSQPGQVKIQKSLFLVLGYHPTISFYYPLLFSSPDPHSFSYLATSERWWLRRDSDQITSTPSSGGLRTAHHESWESDTVEKIFHQFVERDAHGRGVVTSCITNLTL